MDHPADYQQIYTPKFSPKKFAKVYTENGTREIGENRLKNSPKFCLL